MQRMRFNVSFKKAQDVPLGCATQLDDVDGDDDNEWMIQRMRFKVSGKKGTEQGEWEGQLQID